VNLWKISKLQEQIIEMMESGTETESAIAELEKNIALLTADTYGLIEYLEASEESAKKIRQSWQEKEKDFKQKAEKLRSILINFIAEYGINNKISYNNIDYKIKKNPAKLIVDNEELVPDEYKKVTIRLNKAEVDYLDQLGIRYDLVSVDIDKAKIKDLAKDGIGIDGTYLEQGYSLK